VFFYAGSRICNHFLSIVKVLPNDGRCFETAVKRYLLYIAWRFTVIKTGHDLGSFHMLINVKLAGL